jgi:hypothetical protein
MHVGRASDRPNAGLRIGVFACDVTPPLGHPLCGGWIKPVIGFDDPELAKGVVLRDAEGTYVLCTVDWCELRNDAYDLVRDRIARAAGTSPSRVAVQCVHQHNAPLTDSGAQRLLDAEENAPVHADLTFLDAVTDRLAVAVGEATRRMVRVTHVGTSRVKVERVASSRRVRQPDGSIRVRWSSVKEPWAAEAPEGKIDPWLRTLSFFDGDRALAYLHYYATHPQSYYGDGRTTWDFPGIARERLEKETGVFSVYFTGCAGDITAGKYNDGAPARRQELADRIGDAMRRSIASVTREPVGPINWRSRSVRFPPRTEPKFQAEHQRKVLADPQAGERERLGAAVDLAWTLRVAADRPIELSCLALGSIRVLHLPGEPFIDYQLFAQKAAADKFVAVAGYGDGGTGYICTERAYAEGGYEPTASLLAPPSEHLMNRAITELLDE